MTPRHNVGPGPRLQALGPPYSDEVAETLRRMTPPGHDPLLLFRTIAHNPAFLEAFRQFGTYLLNHGSVGASEREIIIHRSTARCGAAYEWAVHAFFYGERVRLTREQILATADPDAANAKCFGTRERMLVRLVDELHETNRVPSALWEQLQSNWTAGELVELVGLVGQYHLVSFIVNAFGVNHEEYARPLAPP